MNLAAYITTRPQPVRRDLPVLLASGFLATLAMTTLMYLLPLAGLAQVDLPIWTARLFVADPVGVGAIGLGLHLVLGLAYAWLYAEQVEPRLTFSPAGAGLVFGAALWAFAQFFAVPALGTIAASLSPVAMDSPGLLALRLGPGAAFASLIAHLAYGGTLGVVYGCHSGGRCR